MYSLHGAQQIYVYEDKKIIKSTAVGSTNVEEIQWLAKSMLEYSKDWIDSGWGYLCCIGDMNPVTSEVSEELINFHKQLQQANLRGIAFVNPHLLSDPDSMVIDVQAKKHHKKSKASYKEKHFRTEEEGIEWLKKILN